MFALIDGDILIYRIGFSSEDIPERLALFRLRDYFDEIQSKLLIKGYKTYITSNDKSNYRFAIDPEYKGNRKAEKPKHYDALRDYLENEEAFNAEMVYGKEADDAIGIHAHTFKTKKDFIILSLDKDLNQIAGWHYNFVKKKKYYLNELSGLRFFYKQILMGDNADNIKGIIGIGEVLANKLIDPLSKESEMYKVVKHIYEDVDSLDNLIKRGQLLKIQTKEQELWQPPDLSQKEINEPVKTLSEVDWKKSFERFSKIQKSRLSTSQSECTSSTPPPSDSTCQTGSTKTKKSL